MVVQADSKRVVLSGFSPVAQTFLCTLFLLPTLWLFYTWWHVPVSDEATDSALAVAAFTLLQDLYLILVVALMSRDGRRRLLAVLVAGVVAAVDTALCFLPQTSDTEMLAYSIVYTLLITAYVAAWGIARRDHPYWRFGLPVAALVAGVGQIYFVVYFGISTWWLSWAVNVGVFLLGCLICWALDVVGRRLAARQYA